jgi:hypothetical protein
MIRLVKTPSKQIRVAWIQVPALSLRGLKLAHRSMRRMIAANAKPARMPVNRIGRRTGGETGGEVVRRTTCCEKNHDRSRHEVWLSS